MVDKALSVKIVKGIKTPKEPGTYHRLLCMTGKNKGMAYYIRSRRIVMGRSEKADVQILDGKSSREHVELSLVAGKYILTDLGSQNGVIVNDLKVSQHTLVDNDKVIIGHTVYKYNLINVEETSLVATDEDENEDNYVEEYEEEKKEKVKKSKKKDQPKKKNNLIVILVVVLAAVFLIPSEDGDKKKRKRQGKKIGEISNDEINIAEYNEEEITDPEVRKKLQAYLQRGQREYREGNYYRAIEQFELALILVPNHGYSTFYRQRAQESLNKFVDKIMAKAENDIAALRYRSAVIGYCSVITFLQDNHKHPRYLEAEKKITELEVKMGAEEGEFKCF